MKMQQYECLTRAGCLAAANWRADGTFYSANRALLRLLGYSSDAIDGGKITWRSITPTKYKSLDDRALEEIRQHGKCSPFEKEYIDRDGNGIPVLIEAAAFGEGTSDAGCFFAVDLRNRKQLTDVGGPETELVSNLSARQQLICLLSSYGLVQKRIAGLLQIGLRTVESDRHRAAKTLGLSTPQATLWAVSNRQRLFESIAAAGLLTPAIEKAIDGRKSCEVPRPANDGSSCLFRTTTWHSPRTEAPA